MKRQQLDPVIAELYNRRLSVEEVAAFLANPVTAAEVEETMELVAWFTRRYPMAQERFAYNRRAYARAVAHSGIALER